MIVYPTMKGSCLNIKSDGRLKLGNLEIIKWNVLTS